jgi:hypothetical protein
MSRTLLAALSAGVLLSAVFGTRAAAMPLAAPAPGIGNASAALLQRVTNICGMNGCVTVYTKRIVRPRPTGKLVSVPVVAQPAPVVVQPAPSLLQKLGL